MKYLTLIIPLFVLVSLGETNFTKVTKRELFNVRRKRYLMFPEGSHYMMSLEYLKHLIREQPEGWYILEELDSAWELPSDTRFLIHGRRHERDRRDIYTKIDEGLTKMGYNGTACVQKIICEAQKYFPMKGSSLFKDILQAVFSVPENQGLYSSCESDPFLGCSISIMNYILQDLRYRPSGGQYE